MSDAVWIKITEMAVEMEKLRTGLTLLRESSQAALDEHMRQIEALRVELAAVRGDTATS